MFVILEAVGGLTSGVLAYQLLGSLTILVVVGFALSEARPGDPSAVSTAEQDEPEGMPAIAAASAPIPSLSFGERIVPLVFLLATAVIVLLLAAFTLQQVGFR